MSVTFSSGAFFKEMKINEILFRFHFSLFRLLRSIYFTLLIAANLTSGVFSIRLQKCPRDRNRENKNCYSNNYFYNLKCVTL